MVCRYVRKKVKSLEIRAREENQRRPQDGGVVLMQFGPKGCMHSRSLARPRPAAGEAPRTRARSSNRQRIDRVAEQRTFAALFTTLFWGQRVFSLLQLGRSHDVRRPFFRGSVFEQAQASETKTSRTGGPGSTLVCNNNRSGKGPSISGGEDKSDECMRRTHQRHGKVCQTSLLRLFR